jgi:protein-L-isoaspartate(D-aspartate) O-methyltransferase
VERARPSIGVLGCLVITMVAPAGTPPASQSPDLFAAARHAMVAEQIAARGVADPRVLAAMREVPRHLFVPAGERADAYVDAPLPIGFGQTISQPYIVALMTELARPAATDSVLEVGTGSGYQAAVLSRLAATVRTIELIEPLARSAEAALHSLGYANIQVRVGDGYQGWPDAAPFDVIVVTAAPDAVPAALVAQLRPGGRLVIPVGPVGGVQDLLIMEKDAAGRTTTRHVIPVRFVPMVRKRD